MTNMVSELHFKDCADCEVFFTKYDKEPSLCMSTHSSYKDGAVGAIVALNIEEAKQLRDWLNKEYKD